MSQSSERKTSSVNDSFDNNVPLRRERGDSSLTNVSSLHQDMNNINTDIRGNF